MLLCMNRKAGAYSAEMSEVGENLKRIRDEKGLSQAKLAKRAKVSQQLISHIEQGVPTSSSKLPQIARALGVSIIDLDPSLESALWTDAGAAQLQIIRELAQHLSDQDLDELVAMARWKAERATRE